MSAGSAGKHLVESHWIESDHDLIVHYNRGRGVAVVFADQVHYGLLVHADISDFKVDTFLRKVVLGPGTRWSAWLAEDYNSLLRHSQFSPAVRFSAWKARFIFFGPARQRRLPRPGESRS
jgi:hypothetical protein